MTVDPRAIEAAEWAVANYVIAADEKEYQGSNDITEDELRLVHLEAAAPYIYARALRDAAQQIYDDLNSGEYDIEWFNGRNFDRKMLIARADELDPADD